jgi:hypothetical protein
MRKTLVPLLRFGKGGGILGSGRGIRKDEDESQISRVEDGE